MSISQRNIAERLVETQIAVGELAARSRRGLPEEMIEPAIRLQTEANNLVAWLTLAIESKGRL